MAESRNELVKYEVDQQSQQFEREVIVQVEPFIRKYISSLKTPGAIGI